MSDELMPIETALGKIYGPNQERYARDMRKPIHDAIAQAYGGADSAAARANSAAADASQAALSANQAATDASQVAADAGENTEIINELLVRCPQFLDTFEQGSVSTSNGTNNDNQTSRIKTAYTQIPDNKSVVWCEQNYKFMVFVFSNRTISGYQGIIQSDGSLAKSGNWTTRIIVHGDDHLLSGKYMKVVLAKENDENISVSDGANVHIAIPHSTTPWLLTSSPLSDIPDGTDYNSMLETGQWLVTNAASASTMTNCPMSGAHKMIVESIRSNCRIQTLISGANGKRVHRVCTKYGSATEWTFTEWFVDLTDQDDVVRRIRNIQDLDLVTKSDTGFLRYTSSTIPLNAPISLPGFLVNISDGSVSAENSMSLYFPVNKFGALHRYRTTSGWENWKLYRADEIIPLSESSLTKKMPTREGGYTSGTSNVGISTQEISGVKGKTIKIYSDIDLAVTLWEADAPSLYERSYRVVRNKSIRATKNFVKIVFYKLENGQTVNTVASDIIRNVIATITNDLDEMTHDAPKSEGAMNAVKRAYQCSEISFKTTADMPVQSYYANEIIPTNTDVAGVVYSSVRQHQLYVPINIGFETYITAIKNPNSYVYTRQSIANNSKTYYGTVCSSFVAYCYGIENVIPTTHSFATLEGFDRLPTRDIYSLEIGDAMMYNTKTAGGHIAIVTDILRKNGEIKMIELCEAWHPVVRRIMYSPEEFKERFYEGDQEYYIYRYDKISSVGYASSPYVPVGDEPVVNNMAGRVIFPRTGDKANWPYGENIEIDLIDYSEYTTYSVVNLDTGSTVKSGNTSSVITLTNMAKGRYKMILHNGSVESHPAYFNVMNPSISYQPQGGGNLKIVFSDTISEPVSMAWCCNVPSDSDYYAIRAFHIFTDEERQQGYAVVEEPDSYAIDAVNHAWLLRVNFKNEFGLYGSPQTVVTITQ